MNKKTILEVYGTNKRKLKQATISIIASLVLSGGIYLAGTMSTSLNAYAIGFHTACPSSSTLMSCNPPDPVCHFLADGDIACDNPDPPVLNHDCSDPNDLICNPPDPVQPGDPILEEE